ncbi:F-box protein Pof7 [Schizosaccharomyces cryophilus OY26]|uniref:F-box protein Pof7 n=1 Tax=Schizosaccharomyces cryophilus (strain OY26 / ATCC MYA-4695 / CBS 11777 / NBRC 106824 / NRRL Y48691) TaxID=653667 RepID=S9VVG8_SCHCR|nr:F-box protein Pof7 [Schizosaccharomyces cryophilus OY26]EPY50095.1 F-box protein Pof7 [Schizosaccharomyces cryophilus OY26]
MDEKRLLNDLEVCPDSGILKKALSHYKEAVESEKEGDIGTSLNRYRLAHKVHEDVEVIYRRLERLAFQNKKEQSDGEQKRASEEESIKSSQADQLSKDLTQPSVTPSLIPKLPDEVLLLIVEQCFENLNDLSYLPLIAQSCKLFAKACRVDSLYRQFCYFSYQQSEWQQTKEDIEEEFSSVYHRSWKEMYLKKPRIRFDGCYISVCRYFRPGVSDTSWNQPVHLISYYRYLRFYPDGTCMVFRTNTEPRYIVRSFGRHTSAFFTPSSSNPTFSNGEVAYMATWSMSPAGQILLSHPVGRAYTYAQNLQVKGSRLKWVSFYSVDNETFETCDFPLTHHRDYVFSRVYSYNSEKTEL